MKKSAIYKITNNITGCVYVGSTTDLDKRLKAYTKFWSNRICGDIKESIITYGIDNHEIRILLNFDNDISRTELEIYEDAFILLYLDSLGEDKILNRRCNTRGLWCSKRLSEKYIENNHMKGVIGVHNYKSKKVNQYSLDGVLIKTWDAIADIQRELSYSQPNISNCCIGKLKHTYGFIWKFVE